MKREFKKLMRSQLQEEIESIAKLSKKRVPRAGWIRTMRDALGMSSAVLSQRLGCSQANITAMEKRERLGTISLESLEHAARGMNCRLVYYIIPEKPIDSLLEDQARIIAEKAVRDVNHSMKLEKQGLTEKQFKQQVNSLTKELLEGNPSDLWNNRDV